MVRCARTYFLTSNAPKLLETIPQKNFAGYVSSYELKEKKDSLFLDEYKVTSIYLKVLQTYLKLTRNLRGMLRNEIIFKAKQAMSKKIKVLNQKLHKYGQEEVNKLSTEGVEIDVKLYTMLGTEVSLDEFSQREELTEVQFKEAE